MNQQLSSDTSKNLCTYELDQKTIYDELNLAP